MGKKNKYAAGAAGGQNPAQPQQQQGGAQQPTPSGSQGPGKQQGGQGQKQAPPQGQQQQRGPQQQQAAQGKQQQQSGQGGPAQGHQQQRGPQQGQGQGGPAQGQEQRRGPQQQQGARGKQPQQSGQGGPAQGQQQQRGPQQGQGQAGPAQGQPQQRGPQQHPQGQGQGWPSQGQQQQQGAWGKQQQKSGQGGPSQGQQQQRGPQQGQGQVGPAQGQQQQRGPQQGQGQGGPAQGQQQQRGPQKHQQGQGQGGPAQGQQQQRGPQQHQQGQGQGGPAQGQQQQRGPQQGQGWGGPAQGQQQQQRGPQQQQRGQGQQQQRYATGGTPQQSLDRSFQQLSVSNEQVIPCKEKSCSGIVRGTLGRAGSLEVNYLKVILDSMPDTVYHYDVTVTPDKPKKFMRPAFEQCKRETFGNIEAAYDGKKSCYTNLLLPGPIEHTVEVPDSGGRVKPFKVEIKETSTCEIDMNSLRNYHRDRVFDKPMRAIQALDVILSATNHDRGIRVGRSFYCRPNQPFDLEEGYEAWTGLFQAALLGEQPLLNVDIAHKSFPRQSTLLEYLKNQQIDPGCQLNNYGYRDVQRFLKGMDIQYDPPANFGSTPRRYKVLDIGDPASTLNFRLDDGQVVTVAAYFHSKGYSLRYPNLNCIKVGSTVKSIHLPMELCSIIAGQSLNRKDGDKQVQKMIRFAATSTNKRKEKIMNILQYFQLNESPIVRAFGVQIGSHFIKVPSRVLPAPYLEYLNGQTVTTSRGAWRMDGKQFLVTSKPPKGHKWAIIYEESRGGRGISYHDLEEFKKDVLKTSQSLTMNLANDVNIIAYGRNQLDSTFSNLLKNSTALVFVVLGNFGTSYAQVKQSAELKVGILTQCIKENTVRRTSRDRSVFSNILLKVNAKLNGTNHKLSRDRDAQLCKLMEPLKRVMYLGADVTHPSPDQRHIPSVVGVTASHDAFGACYNLQYRLQESKQEHIVDMETIVTQHLKVYHKYQNCYPEQIIYYRDGVSDGQFPIITTVELRAIRNACNKLKINMKLTCIIVVKRHHTRFFPMTQPREDRDFNNVEPGTVVDQHITHPNEVQFFMVSHQAIQGTAKPTRYNVIVDDSKFDINFLQKLTYNLCHLFPRCNRPVSYPAPAYLAHLVAFRGRVYLEGSFKFSNNLKSEYEKRLIKPEFMVTNPMYFV